MYVDIHLLFLVAIQCEKKTRSDVSVQTDTNDCDECSKRAKKEFKDEGTLVHSSEFIESGQLIEGDSGAASAVSFVTAESLVEGAETSVSGGSVKDTHDDSKIDVTATPVSKETGLYQCENLTNYAAWL